MTDTPQQVPLEPSSPQPETAPGLPNAVPPQPKKSSKKLWTIAGIALGLFACCCMLGVAAIVVSTMNTAREKAPIEALLDSYMQAMMAKDVEAAYALFSPRAQRQIPISRVQELLEGNNYLLFEGYRDLSVVSANISASANTDPNQPQGTVARVQGTLFYAGGIEGSFNGVLEKVGDEWQLDAIHITVPPDKFE